MNKNFFIPKNPAKLVIVDYRADQEIIRNLEKLDIKIIKTTKCKEVSESISFHPDIVLHPLDNNKLLVAANVFDYYSKLLKPYNIDLIKGKSYLSKKYPFDISYNIARIGDKALHNLKYTDPMARKYLERQGIKFIDVKQGYSKCSLALIGKDLGITSDIPIYKKLTNLGYDILLIRPGYINLPGENYGFIGGATGNFSESELVLSGRLDKHPDKDRIINFIEKNNKKIIYLSQKEIVDLGTLIFL